MLRGHGQNQEKDFSASDMGTFGYANIATRSFPALRPQFVSSDLSLIIFIFIIPTPLLGPPG